MIKTVAHLADIHVKNKLTTHEEIKQVIDNTIISLIAMKPDRIVIVGDLLHNFIDINNETKIIAGDFLVRLSKIAKVIITQGNHDINSKSLDRVDSIETIIKLLNNSNIIYLNKTDFFTDENIVYAVWHHSDKTSPWEKHQHIKDSSKLYIDLFHDPINGCLSESLHKMDSVHYVKLSDFKGDLGFFGDIHLQQDYNKNNKIFGAYPSSLYETKYSEGDGRFHGYLLWDISDYNNVKQSKIKIENKWSHHNITISNGFDYSNIVLDIKTENLTEFSRLKIKWVDYSTYMNKENIRNIRNHIKKNYPNIFQIDFDRQPIMVNKLSKQEEILLKNINDKQVQQDTFKEFLKERKYSDEVISDVLLLDNIINDRLGIIENVLCDIKIHSFKFNYFRNYGENNSLNWNSKDGVYQIGGANATGKSTIFYFIMYMLFTKTPSTIKKDKFRDNKFINNRLEVDFCDGEMILEINSLFIKIKKRTEREWLKNKVDIKACPTKIEYIKLNELFEEIGDENDTEKNKTQKLIEESIGTYDDFVRKVYTDADTLNKLLSNDKSDFIDNILLDTGLDVFDKKLEDYKDYIKTLAKKTDKVNINPIVELAKIDAINITISEHESEIKSLKDNDLNILLSKIETENLNKEAEIKKIHIIDNKFLNISVENLNNDIEKYNIQKNSKLEELKNLDNEINSLPDTYEKELLLEYNTRIEKFKEWKYSKSESINKFNSEINTNKLKQNKLTNDVLSFKKDIEQLHKDIITEKNFIKKDIENLKNEINKLEESKSKTCPICKRGYGEKELLIIDNSIIKLNNEIKEKELSLDSNHKIDTINKTIISTEEKIELINIEIPKFDELNKNLLVEISKIETTVKENVIKSEEFTQKIILIESVKSKVEKRENLLSIKSNIPLLIENIDLKIDNIKRTIDEYNLCKDKIKENGIIESVVRNINETIKVLNTEKQILLDKINNIENILINNLKNEITQILILIEKHKKQEHIENVNKAYMECLHRDGLPTMLLRKLLPTINNELKDLLSDVDFNLSFDNDINLRMYNNTHESSQDVLDGSGMERTFISFVLKFTLMKISNKSRFNMLLLDVGECFFFL